jgi:hypothetical protein
MSIGDAFQPVLKSPLAVRQMPHHLKQPSFGSMAKGADHRSANSVFMRYGRMDSSARKAPASVDDIAHMLLPVLAARRLKAAPRAGNLLPRRFCGDNCRRAAPTSSRAAPTDNFRNIAEFARCMFGIESLCGAAESFWSHRIFSARSKERPGSSHRAERLNAALARHLDLRICVFTTHASKMKKRVLARLNPAVQEHEQNPQPSPETVAEPFAKSFASSSVHCQYIRGQ